MRVSTRVRSNHLNALPDVIRGVTTLIVPSPYNIDLLASREKKKENKKKGRKNKIKFEFSSLSMHVYKYI